MERAMRVDVWSDVVCPWCYIGKRHLEQALSSFDHASQVEVVFHSFELDPSAPVVMQESLASHLAEKYGMPVEQAESMMQNVTDRAASVGLEFHLDKAIGGNTFNAHRMLHLAAAHGRQTDLKEALMRAYFTDAQAIGEVSVLRDVAVTVGLDEALVDSVLRSDAYADDVRRDEAQARAFGITGVPYFVIDSKYGISGAQPAGSLLSALQQAWAEKAPVLTPIVGEGEACSVDDPTC